MNVAVIGAGRAELLTAGEFANLAGHAQCADIDEGKIAALARETVH